jgi:hypothetical protein
MWLRKLCDSECYVTQKVMWLRKLCDSECYVTQKVMWLRKLCDSECYVTQNVMWLRKLCDSEYYVTQNVMWLRKVSALRRSFIHYLPELEHNWKSRRSRWHFSFVMSPVRTSTMTFVAFIEVSLAFLKNFLRVYVQSCFFSNGSQFDIHDPQWYFSWCYIRTARGETKAQ